MLPVVPGIAPRGPEPKRPEISARISGEAAAEKEQRTSALLPGVLPPQEDQVSEPWAGRALQEPATGARLHKRWLAGPSCKGVWEVALAPAPSGVCRDTETLSRAASTLRAAEPLPVIDTSPPFTNRGRK